MCKATTTPDKHASHGGRCASPMMICGAELETRMARLEAKIDPVSGRTSDERKYAKQPRRSGA